MSEAMSEPLSVRRPLEFRRRRPREWAAALPARTAVQHPIA